MFLPNEGVCHTLSCLEENFVIFALILFFHFIFFLNKHMLDSSIEPQRQQEHILWRYLQSFQEWVFGEYKIGQNLDFIAP